MPLPDVVRSGLSEEGMSELEARLAEGIPEDALALQRYAAQAVTCNDLTLQSEALVLLGCWYYMAHHYAEAQSAWVEAAGAARQAKLPAQEGRAVNGLGLIALEQGQYGRAIAHFDTSLALARELNDFAGIARALNNLALAWTRLGRPERALNYMGQSQEFLLRFRHPVDTFTVAMNLIWLNMDSERYDRAYAICNMYLPIAREHQIAGHIADVLCARALCQVRLGLVPEAEASIKEVLPYMTVPSTSYGEATCTLFLGRTCLGLQQTAEAVGWLEKAVVYARADHNLDVLSAAHKELAQLYHEQQQHGLAYDHSWAYFAVQQKMFPVDMSFIQE